MKRGNVTCVKVSTEMNDSLPHYKYFTIEEEMLVLVSSSSSNNSHNNNRDH